MGIKWTYNCDPTTGFLPPTKAARAELEPCPETPPTPRTDTSTSSSTLHGALTAQIQEKAEQDAAKVKELEVQGAAAAIEIETLLATKIGMQRAARRMAETLEKKKAQVITLIQEKEVLTKAKQDALAMAALAEAATDDKVTEIKWLNFQLKNDAGGHIAKEDILLNVPSRDKHNAEALGVVWGPNHGRPLCKHYILAGQLVRREVAAWMRE